MNFKNYMKGSNVLQINRRIGGEKGIDCATVADGILCLENEGKKSLEVRVNTMGGNIVEGYSLFAAIRNSSMDIKMYNDYLAASMGGVLMMAVPIENRFMASNALLMLHNVSSPNNDPKSLEIGQKMKDSIVESFVKATGKDASVISDLMDNETWLNAKEAVEMGFFLKENIFDAVVSDPKLNKNNTAKNAAEIYEYSNDLFNQKDNMDKELQELKDKAKAQEDKLSALEIENKALKSSLEDKDKSLAVATEKEATALVENAIDAGKLSKESKEANVKLAIKDLDGFKNLLASIPAVSKAASFTNYAGSQEDKSKASDGSRSDWSHRDWEKKDATGLANIYKNEPAKAAELYDNCYKVK